ncbi:activating signal cointegrator 1 complex subunit 2 [Dermatophagoides farinae]|uniref:Activating signal cointegrator 1 complex subunit 2 n=1 Tax=Dermatophagoides farinae TaxID=6954 RepID=A0A9D4P884_DERFA|nr:activating signal cointegrator 1 complex subunit 2 [Dermatophagoides farinae]
MDLKPQSSFRCKSRSSDKMNRYDPLEKRRIVFLDRNREQKSLPLISKEFNIRINFPLYYEPSSNEMDNFNSMNSSKWIHDCKMFESSLNSIVHLPYFRFWSVIVYNPDVHTALESYLNYVTRPYRIHPIIKHETIGPVSSSIHSLVFRIYIRILLHKESEENYMSEDYHSELLIKNNILDISKILDLIQIYGYGPNSEMLKFLLKSFFQRNYSKMKNDVVFVLKEIFEFFFHYENYNSYDLNNEMFYVIANITDVLFSLNKLIQYEPRIAFIYEDGQLLNRLIKFHSLYFPYIENETLSLYRSNTIVENFYNYFKSQICLSKASSLLLFRKIIHTVYIEPLANLQDDLYKLFDNLMRLLDFLANKERFCVDYFEKFSFEKEFESLRHNPSLDKELTINDVLEYYRMNFNTLIEKHKSQNSEKVEKPQAINLEQTSKYSFRIDPETISKEQLIAEMFPELGNGFIYKCLEHYDFNNERVVDAILESNLPAELNSLDRKLTKSDLDKVASMLDNVKSSGQMDDQILTDSQKYNPINNANYQLADIYIGKKDKLSEMKANKEKTKNVTIELAEKIEKEEEELKEQIKLMIERGKLQRKTNNMPKYRMANEKYENCAKYLRKQLYNNKYQQRNNQGKGQQSFNNSYGSNDPQQRQRQTVKNQQYPNNTIKLLQSKQ